MEFRIQGLGLRVQGLEFRVWGLGFRVQGSIFRFWGLGFSVGLKVQDVGLSVQVLWPSKPPHLVPSYISGNIRS